MDGLFDPSKAFHIYHNRMPQWRQPYAMYFITTRLADSLPKSVLATLEETTERNEDEEWEPQEQPFNHYLDAGYGSCILRYSTAYKILKQCIQYNAEIRFTLLEGTIDTNHVHLLIRVLDEIPLGEIIKGWKNSSAHRILKIPSLKKAFQQSWERHFPGRSFQFWQKSNYTRIPRSELEVENIIKYIQKHPRGSLLENDF